MDVEGLNPTGKTLGGFAKFEDNPKRVEKQFIKQASHMIQRVWHNDESVTVYLIMGLGLLLEINEIYIKALSDDQIETALHNFEGAQTDLTKHRLNSKTEESIAYYIAKTLLSEEFNDDGKEFQTLIRSLDLEDPDDRELIEHS